MYLDQEVRVLIAATLDVLKMFSNLKLTEREIALLNTVVLFQPGKFSTYSQFAVCQPTKFRAIIQIKVDSFCNSWLCHEPIL